MATDPHANVAPYALDALDPQDEREFERHLASCERCREELAALRETAADLAYGADGPAPPPELKLRILESAKAERTNVSSLSKKRRRRSAAITAAAALAAAFALGIGVSGTVRSHSDPLASVLAKPGAKLVTMPGHGVVAVAPDQSAAVALTLPRAPAGKTYEAWVIRKGKARPAGLFTASAVFKLQRSVPRGSVIAVTLEPAGGVDQPTTKPLTASEAIS
jgi:anti-sigma-K factor RskA